jgi:hypothetical protein
MFAIQSNLYIFTRKKVRPTWLFGRCFILGHHFVIIIQIHWKAKTNVYYKSRPVKSDLINLSPRSDSFRSEVKIQLIRGLIKLWLTVQKKPEQNSVPQNSSRSNSSQHTHQSEMKPSQSDENKKMATFQKNKKTQEKNNMSLPDLTSY